MLTSDGKLWLVFPEGHSDSPGHLPLAVSHNALVAADKTGYDLGLSMRLTLQQYPVLCQT